ncbi:MAG: glutathione S-transferase family protein [Hyphomicrobiaceae bacterium]
MYKLIGLPATRAFRIIWMMEELGLRYEIDPVAPHTDEARAFNPSGKIPMLQVGDDILLDSVAICQFLADRHSKLTFVAGSVERGKQDGWTQFAVDDVESTLWYSAKHSFVLPEELRSKTVLKACRYDFDRAMTAFEKRLGDNEFVMGDTFTVPDILFGHLAGWAMVNAKWDIPKGKVSEYFSRVRSRPAFERAMATRKKFD